MKKNETKNSNNKEFAASPIIKKNDFAELILKHLNSSEIIREIYYRYNHEANKIIFWIKTVKFILKYLLETKISKAIFIFATFLLIKSFIRCKFILFGLKNKNNKYNQLHFEEFIESDFFEQTINNFEDLLKKTKIIKSFFYNSSKFSFYLKKFKLENILKGKITEIEFSSIINSQLFGIIKEKVKFDCDSVSKELLKIILFTYFSKESHSLFSYWTNNKKFNWEKMEKKFESISLTELKEMVLKIKEVLSTS